MRVLMVSADRGLFGRGSSGDVVARHQKYADGVGHLDVVVFSDDSNNPVAHSGNFRVFPSCSGKFTHWRKAASLALELAKEQGYDLVHTQDIAAPAGEKVKKVLGIPFTVSVHSMFFSSEWLKLNPLNWYLLWRLKRSMRAADGFRVNTEVIAEKLRDWFGNVPILIQPTPADISSFFVDKKPDNEVPVALYVGRLSPEKNVGMLVRAVRSLEDEFKLIVVGDGAEREKLEELADGDKRITFTGAKPYSELPEMYKQADIFVLPSNTESFGKVLLEAGAAKCAIVATRTAGATSILTHEKDALLIDVDNQTELEAALARLSNNKDLRVALGEEACATARGYSSDAGVAKTVDFWRQIAEK